VQFIARFRRLKKRPFAQARESKSPVIAFNSALFRPELIAEGPVGVKASLELALASISGLVEVFRSGKSLKQSCVSFGLAIATTLGSHAVVTQVFVWRVALSASLKKERARQFPCLPLGQNLADLSCSFPRAE